MRELTGKEREVIRTRFVKATGDRELIERLAVEMLVPFDTVARALPTDTWVHHVRTCVECSQEFTERRPPQTSPRHDVCAACAALRFPGVRVGLPRSRNSRARRRPFSAPCTRGCGRLVHGYLTAPDNPVPTVCADCVAAEYNAETLAAWRAEHA